MILKNHEHCEYSFIGIGDFLFLNFFLRKKCKSTKFNRSVFIYNHKNIRFLKVEERSSDSYITRDDFFSVFFSRKKS